MIEYYTRLAQFWQDDLTTHSYARTVYFTAENFDHLNRNYYNSKYILQSFNQELSCADKFKKELNVINASVSWTCILPNVILPIHKDTFFNLRQEHDINIDRCYRYLVFLEDWVFGHYVGFENKNINGWIAGDVWKFNSNELHYGVNASNVSFHTCQISTFD